MKIDLRKRILILNNSAYKMKLIHLILFCCIVTIGTCKDNSFDRNKSLGIDLIDSVIVIKKDDSKISFKVVLSNKTDRNLLLYGFTILEESASDLNFYKKPEITAGMVPYLRDLKNLNGKNVYIGLDEEQLCGRPITMDSVLRRLTETGSQLYKLQMLKKAAGDFFKYIENINK